MKANNIFYSSYFLQRFSDIPQEIQQKTLIIEKKFRENCFHEELKTSYLKKFLAGLWSLPIDSQYAIIFEFIDSTGNVGFIDIGNISIYHPLNE